MVVGYFCSHWRDGSLEFRRYFSQSCYTSLPVLRVYERQITVFYVFITHANDMVTVQMLILIQHFAHHTTQISITSSLYNILCTVNTQHTSRQDAIITVRLYLATCFGRNRPSSGQLRTILRYIKIALNVP